MSDKDENLAIPPPLRDSLHTEPEDRRRELTRIWNLLGTSTPEQDVDTSIDEAWNDLLIRLESDTRTAGRARDRHASQRSDRRRAGFTLAAVIAAVILILSVWFLRSPVTIVAEPGMHQDVTLPDGSIVEMNSATELRYSRYFGVPVLSPDDRHVQLTGEAFFIVEPEAGRFVVETPDALIEVLGTEFNVRSRPGSLEGGTEVTVATGSVRVEAKSTPDQPVVLSRPGASGTVSDEGRILQPDTEQTAALDHVLAWRQSGFVAIDRPIAAILDEVERRYGLTIAPRDGVDLNRSTSVFYLRGGTVDQILSAICLTEGCTYRETSRGFALSAQDSTQKHSYPGFI